MNNQHAKISGYRDLTETDLQLINHIKAIEENVRVLLNSMHQSLKDADPEAVRWLAIGRNHLETGFMFTIKAVARPTNGLGRATADNRTIEEHLFAQAEAEAAEQPGDHLN